LFKDQFIGSYKGRICFSTSSYGRQQSSYRFLDDHKGHTDIYRRQMELG
jgi:hypothetical protein